MHWITQNTRQSFYFLHTNGVNVRYLTNVYNTTNRHFAPFNNTRDDKDFRLFIQTDLSGSVSYHRLMLSLRYRGTTFVPFKYKVDGHLTCGQGKSSRTWNDRNEDDDYVYIKDFISYDDVLQF